MDFEARERLIESILLALPDRDPLTVGDVLAHQRALFVDAGLSDDIAREWLVNGHYFKTWDRVEAAADRPIDRRFEAAADAIATGDLPTLARLLAEDPTLARARSAYGHGQTLLQHCSANGIEVRRQRTYPTNAPELARMLLAAGAEPDATCESYAPGDTALTLACSSAHPAEAGVQAELVEVLVAGGAHPDGPASDSEPLWTAITWGYPRAVDALVRAGARVDNLVLAACVGDLALVKQLVDAPRAPMQMGVRGKLLPAEHLLEYALIYACGCDRREVIAYLLTRGPDLAIQEPLYQATALDIAIYSHPAAGRPDGNREIIELLTERGAPADDLRVGTVSTCSTSSPRK